MISLSLVFLLLFSTCLRSISPLEIIWDYDDQQITENNFTITCELQVDQTHTEPFQSSPLGLILEVPADEISLEVWCEPPATLVTDVDSSPSKHACQLSDVDLNEQPTITMVLLAADPGEILPTIRIQTSSPMEQQGDKTIVITVRRRRAESECAHLQRSFRRGKV